MKAIFKHISNQIAEHLVLAEKSLCVAVAWFTNETLFEIVLDKVRKGVVVELLVNNDHINNRLDGLDFNNFIKLGGKFYFADTSRLMHHKFVIIDNHTLISGSYNWTYNAEFRNNENIVLTDHSETVEQFNSEFSFLKKEGLLQIGIITAKPSKTHDYDLNEYLKDDYYFKSVAEEKRGNIKKSLKAIQTAQQIDQTDLKIIERVSEVQKKVENPEYCYHVEDGQFSFDYYDKKLLGKEGDVIKISDGNDTEKDAYILYIDGFYIECIGDIERHFPKSKEEHDEIKEWTIKLYSEY